MKQSADTSVQISLQSQLQRQLTLIVLTVTCSVAVNNSWAAKKYAAIVYDFDTQKIVHQAHAQAPRYPASIAKAMTLYLVFKALDEGRLDMLQALPVSVAATKVEPTKLGLKAGNTIRVKEAILALVTKSANDVAIVVAEALAGTEAAFAKQMTMEAKRLDMHNTTFKNASGLPHPKQVSSAHDLMLLGKALLRDFPNHYHFFNTQSFKYRNKHYKNHNKLLSKYPGCDGIKTGYIRKSGFNLLTSAMKEGRRLIVVVMGGRTSKSRNQHTMKLLDNGFKKILQNKPTVLP